MAVLGLLALVTAFLAWFELVCLYPIDGWAYGLVGLGLTVTLLMRACPLRRRIRWGGLTAAWCGLAVLYFVPWSSRKPFLRDLWRVQPGMTETEARQVMGAYMEGTGWPSWTAAKPEAELTIPNALVFRHSNHARFNSDWGIIWFTNGRVAAVEFSPD